MEVRRIDPEDGVGRLFKGLTRRVAGLETRPAGEIVIRESITTTDENGVSTIIGRLPDGSNGLQEFVNDIDPPNKPSTPVVEPTIQGINVFWDGKDEFGADQPKDYNFTELEYRRLGDVDWKMGSQITGATATTIPQLIVGTTYEVRLSSLDRNNNRSEYTAPIQCTPVSVIETEDVANAIAELKEADRKQLEDIGATQGLVTEAHSAADRAAQSALEAAGAAAGKGKVIFSDTAPTGEDRNVNNLWVNISGGANTPHRWNGTAWVEVKDKDLSTAVSKAVAAEAAAQAASAEATRAAQVAGAAQQTADGKNAVWYLQTAPAGNAHRENDLWFDKQNGNRPMRWNGSSWESVQDQAISSASEAASAALTSANGKNTNYYTSSAPVSTTNKPLIKGDLWFDTSNNYRLSTWSGSAWVTTQDSRAALVAANGKSKSSVGPTAPSSPAVGDLWIDTANGNAIKVYGSSGWTSYQDADIAQAIQKADVAVSSANGKNTNTYSANAPTTALGAGRAVGDAWFRQDASGKVYAHWIWDGSSWNQVTYRHEIFDSIDASKISTGSMNARYITSGSITAELGLLGNAVVGTAQIEDLAVTDAKISTLNAGKITFGEMHGDRIQANSIDVNKLLIGAFDNLVSNPDMVDGAGWAELSAGTGSGFSTEQVAPGTSRSIKLTQRTAGSSNMTIYSPVPRRIPVSPGESFYFSVMARTTGTSPYSSVSVRAYYYGANGAMLSGTAGNVGVNDLTSMASNTWIPMTGQTTAPANAAYMTIRPTVYYPNTATPTSAVFYFGDFKIFRVSDATLIQDGAISTSHITSGGLDAAVIKFGEMSGARIQAGTINAEKLLVGVGANLLVDPQFLNDTLSATRRSLSTGTWVTEVDSGTRVMNMKTTAASGVQVDFTYRSVARTFANVANFIPCTGGETYQFEVSVYTNTAQVVRWCVGYIKADGTTGSATVGTTPAAASQRRTVSAEWLVPAGVVAFDPWIRLQTATAATTFVVDGTGYVSRKVTGSLIVDGAIDGQTITGATIQSTATANRGVKLSSAGLIAYNNSGVETLRLEGSTATITGATVRTAASGARVQMSTSGLEAWDANNTRYLLANGSGLTMMGEIISELEAPLSTDASTIYRSRSIIGHRTSRTDFAAASRPTPGLWFEAEQVGTTSTPMSMPAGVLPYRATGESIMMRSGRNNINHAISAVTLDEGTLSLVAANSKASTATSRTSSELFMSPTSWTIEGGSGSGISGYGQSVFVNSAYGWKSIPAGMLDYWTSSTRIALTDNTQIVSKTLMVNSSATVKVTLNLRGVPNVNQQWTSIKATADGVEFGEMIHYAAQNQTGADATYAFYYHHKGAAKNVVFRIAGTTLLPSSSSFIIPAQVAGGSVQTQVFWEDIGSLFERPIIVPPLIRYSNDPRV